ncbi:hypothetical protein [Alkalihalobacillus sp. 1P02AB]|uniref:hypothetical protein n=1 Tax=Alkalihalobacillus sp. 1P02AB TaxID=3132260 RepID=UPI0039A4139E
MNYNNGIGKVLFYIGAGVIIFGLLAGVILGTEEVGYSRYEFIWSIFFIYTLSGLISGFLIIGMAEMIERQTETNKLLKKLVYPNSASNQVAVSVEENANSVEAVNSNENKLKHNEVDWDFEGDDLVKIHDYVEKRGNFIQDIIATPFKYKYIAVIKNEPQLFMIDSEYSNKLVSLKLSTYPKVEKWWNEYKHELK